ncbi:MAG: histidine phosphatase family protein [Caulobacteraceae bacterium]
MRRLILFRHAKAEPRAPGGEDIDRALTPRGERDAALMGGVLARAGLAPDLALVSPALRAAETWRWAREAFAGFAVQVRDGLYNATPEEVAAELDLGTAGADTVIVVGHNPSLQELAVSLLIDGDGSAGDIERVSARFGTATAAALRLDAAGRAALEALFHARDHGGDGQ